MAISIKNHEDRITALEKMNHHISMWSGSITLNDGNWHQVCKYDSYPEIIVVKYSFNRGSHDECWLNGFVWNHPYMLGQKEMIVEITRHGGIDINNDKFENFQIKRGSDDNIYVRSLSSDDQYNDSNGILDIFGLKLYYNFSYNITREFYKVKFKLKHYLCSHLQKFI